MKSTTNPVIEELFKKMYPAFVGYAQQKVNNKDDAEDIVMQAMERAIMYFDSDVVKDVDRWFRKILVNCINEYYRNREETEGVDPDDVCSDEDLEKELSVKQDWDRVADMINDQSDSYRHALWMFFINGHKPKEITGVVDITPKHLKQVLWRFRNKLREVV